MIRSRCLIRTDDGICNLPAVGRKPVEVGPHSSLFYDATVAIEPVLVCEEHMKLFTDGWKLRASLVFRWVPPG